jgi:7-cyano-7-deazaguanine synthase
MGKKVVLVSGGLDSGVLLGNIVALYGAENVIALNLFYGQKHSIEMACARALCDFYRVKLVTMDISKVFEFDKSCPLLSGSTNDIPDKSYAEQLDAMGGSGTVKTYIPFRNGLLLSAATAIALQHGADEVYYGAHADDAAGAAYPDCTDDFIASMADAIWYGSGRKVLLQAPWNKFTKAQIVSEGIELKVPFEYTWSCYNGGNKPCGKCATCIDRAAAFAANGIQDPATHVVIICTQSQNQSNKADTKIPNFKIPYEAPKIIREGASICHICGRPAEDCNR